MDHQSYRLDLSNLADMAEDTRYSYNESWLWITATVVEKGDARAGSQQEKNTYS
ncbi:MAG: hypothetical protein U0905_15845 [Pirellulales bacterium]